MPHETSPSPYRGIGGISTAEVWAGTGAEVGIVALRFMDPFPTQIMPEVNVERAYTAVLLLIATTKR